MTMHMYLTVSQNEENPNQKDDMSPIQPKMQVRKPIDILPNLICLDIEENDFK